MNNPPGAPKLGSLHSGLRTHFATLRGCFALRCVFPISGPSHRPTHRSLDQSPINH